MTIQNDMTYSFFRKDERFNLANGKWWTFPKEFKLTELHPTKEDLIKKLVTDVFPGDSEFPSHIHEVIAERLIDWCRDETIKLISDGDEKYHSYPVTEDRFLTRQFGKRFDLGEIADLLYSKVPVYRPTVYDKESKTYSANPKPRPSLEELYSSGLLRKEQLEHGKYYIGSCRNAQVARWDAKANCFRHIRTKFGNSFEEEIPHPADCDGFDIFAAVAEFEPEPDEIVKGGFEG